jgi:glycosyltransferase involved in cell wall biosynthesis
VLKSNSNYEIFTGGLKGLQQDKTLLKLPVSAIVVGFNEGKLLKNCLPSVQFCDEILYFDLGSSDNSIAIAKEFGAIVIMHEKVLSCEWIHAEYASKVKNAWILIIDPDEVMGIDLQNEIIAQFHTIASSDNIGSVTVPWLFYFKKSRLKGTAWGGVNHRILLVNNKRFQFSPYIHIGRKLLDGYSDYKILFNGTNAIHHYWMQTYDQLIEKHKRYLKNEGIARFENGQGSSRKIVLNEIFSSFKYSFRTKEGYLDGFKGLFLSLLWSWYQSMAQYKLYQHQKNIKGQ